MPPGGRIPGPLGINAIAGLTTSQLQVKVAMEVEKRVVKQIGKRVAALAVTQGRKPHYRENGRKISILDKGI